MSETSIQKELGEIRELVEKAITIKSGRESDMFAEIKDHLRRQDDKFTALETKIDPMLRAFNTSENKKIVWGKFGVEIKNKSLWVIYFFGALTAIWAALKFGIKILKL